MGKLLILCEKKSVEMFVRRFLGRFRAYDFDKDIVFDYFGCVLDMVKGNNSFTWKDGKVYMHGNPVDGFGNLTLQEYLLEEDRFAISKQLVGQNLKDGKYLMSDVDRTIVVLGHPWFDMDDTPGKEITYPEDVLATKYFLEHYGMTLSDVKCVCYADLSDESLQKAFVNEESFDEVFSSVIEKYVVPL